MKNDLCRRQFLLGLGPLAAANFALACTSEAEPSIHLRQTRGAFLHGSRAMGGGVWLRLSGDRTRDISVIGNDLARARRAIATDPEVGRDAVFAAANRIFER